MEDAKLSRWRSRPVPDWEEEFILNVIWLVRYYGTGVFDQEVFTKQTIMKIRIATCEEERKWKRSKTEVAAGGREFLKYERFRTERASASAYMPDSLQASI